MSTTYPMMSASVYSTGFEKQASTGGGGTFKVHFLSEYEVQARNIEYDAKTIMARALSSNLTSANNGDTITIDSTDYKIIAMEPDGYGETILRLSNE